MGGKQERQSIYRGQHSQNQGATRREKQARIKGFGRIDRAYKTASREERIKRSLEEFEEEARVRIQSEQAVQHGLQHAIQRLLDRFVTQQEAEDIFRNEQVIDSYTTSGGTQVTITVVDF